MLELTTRLAKTDGVLSRATLSLTWEQRQHSRQRVLLEDGQPAALLLPRGTRLRDGDLLASAGGQVVRVQAALEYLSLAPCADGLRLARACYHLGNRHAPVQISAGGVMYQRDHVLDEMLRGLGLEPRAISAAFEPEAGAYHGHGGGHQHGA
ncbi:MAG: urease accessory protein UreE [Desulfarculus sp.]|nr:urease accessory protein UreE [Desulfarculus sp.]